MIAFLKKIHSRDCGPFWQFVGNGAIGVIAALVQTGVFCLLATTCLRRFGLMTMFAVLIVAVGSFRVDFFVRRFHIYRG